MYLVREETCLICMGRHLTHVQNNLTFKLKAYRSFKHVPSKVGNPKGKVEELGKLVEHLKKVLDNNQEMIMDR